MSPSPLSPASTSPIFEPAKLGPITLRNRIIKAATFEGRTPGALVSDQLIDFHRSFAKGGVGMTTVAYCAVSPEGRTEVDQLFWRPEALPGLRKLTDAVHAEGAAIAAQIGHAGPVADESSHGLKALTPKKMFHPLSLTMTHGATKEDLERVVEDHRRATLYAIECGFDAVEIHFGHNYLASSFLSPRLNRRKDEYGGSLENRARVVRETARAVREAAGDKIAVTAKLNMRDAVFAGFDIEESLEVARWIEADGSLDALQLTAGSSLLNPMYLFHGDVPVREFAQNFRQPIKAGLLVFGRLFLKKYRYHPLYLLELARTFRAELKLPLILLGGVTDHEALDRAVEEGFDFVAMGRALLADPDLPNQLKADRSAKSRCIHCNRCMPTIYQGTHCPIYGAPPAAPSEGA